MGPFLLNSALCHSGLVVIALCLACAGGDKHGHFDASAPRDAALQDDGTLVADAVVRDVNPRDYTFVPCSHDNPCPEPFECDFFEHAPSGAYKFYLPC